MSLLTKKKLEFVDGSMMEPDDDDDAVSPYWKQCNTLILAWLTRAMEPLIAQSFIFIDSARTLWLELQECLFESDLFRISDIQEEIF